MYALTGGFLSKPGKRDELISILLQAADQVSGIDGCHTYIVCEDVSTPVGVAVFEVWDSKEAHDISLKDEKVRMLISNARPLIDGISNSVELQVVGGHGI